MSPSGTLSKTPDSARSQAIGYVMVAMHSVTCIGLSMPSVDVLRYVAYLLPFIAISAWNYLPQVRTNHSLLDCVAIFVAISVIAVFFTSSISPFSVSPYASRDFFIILGYLIIFAIGWRPSPRQFDIVLLTSAALLAIKYGASGRGFTLSLLKSSSLDENYDDYDSFMGLALVLYYLRYGRNWRLLLALAIMVFGGKRISLGAFSLGAVFLAFSLFTLRKNEGAARIVFGIVLVTIGGVAANFVRIVEFAFDNVPQLSGYYIEEFMAGRYVLSDSLLRIFEDKNWIEVAFGSGPGASDAIVVDMNIGISLTHNDWLKILVDYGYVGLAAFLFIYYRIFGANIWTMALGVMNAIIMMTDNVLIYIFYQFPIIMTYWALIEPNTVVRQSWGARGKFSPRLQAAKG